MKLNELLENTGTTIQTETGTATLFKDGSMVVDNSGYRQHLTPAQVQAAWSGAKQLPLSPSMVQDMKDDGLTDDEMLEYAPMFDGDYWDFGDEQHVIPSKEDFIEI